jgi:hypothetical protein
MNNEQRKDSYVLASVLSWCTDKQESGDNDEALNMLATYSAQVLDKYVKDESPDTLRGLVMQLDNMEIKTSIKSVVKEPERRVLTIKDIRMLAKLDPATCIICELTEKKARTCEVRKLMNRLLIPEDEVSDCGYRLY